MELGKIIFLHGASSSGKTTIARALQDALPEAFWHVSIDKLRDADVLPQKRFSGGEFSWAEHRARFFDGFHQSLIAYTKTGNNLILEHIIEETSWRPTLANLLSPFDVFFVKVACPSHILIEREAARGDRPLGSAIKDFHTIHEGLNYDHVVEGVHNAEDNARSIMTAWNKRTQRSALFESFRD